MSVEELNALERYLEIWMYNIRSAKVIQFQHIYLFLKTCSKIMLLFCMQYYYEATSTGID